MGWKKSGKNELVKCMVFHYFCMCVCVLAASPLLSLSLGMNTVSDLKLAAFATQWNCMLQLFDCSNMEQCVIVESCSFFSRLYN